MRIGWMWFDNAPSRTFEEKVALAVRRYEAKFGRAPDVCCVNPAALDGAEETVCGGVRVVAARNVGPGYFWLGVEGEQKNVPQNP